MFASQGSSVIQVPDSSDCNSHRRIVRDRTVQALSVAIQVDHHQPTASDESTTVNTDSAIKGRNGSGGTEGSKGGKSRDKAGPSSRIKNACGPPLKTKVMRAEGGVNLSQNW
jgi:hypothetical protein